MPAKRALSEINTYLYLQTPIDSEVVTNAIGINEIRGELAHTLFAIEDADLLRCISRYVKRLLKADAEKETEYIEKEELLSSIREGLREVTEARRTGQI